MLKSAAVASILIFVPTFIFLLAYHMAPAVDEEIESKAYNVVDSYHGCDIIRYTDTTNRWHYFMKCND
jgi:hypothetical protein